MVDTLEQEEEQEFFDQADLVKALDQETDKRDNEIKLLKEQLANEKLKLEEYEAKRAFWVDGDWSKLAIDHPFEIVVHQDENDLGSQFVKVSHNTRKWQIPRGTPYRIPKYILEILERAVTDAWVKIPDPVTDNLKMVHIYKKRFDFVARPIWEGQGAPSNA